MQLQILPDVVAFITAKDIPGVNNYAAFLYNQEEIFVSDKVHYAGQAVGLLVARSRYAAYGARSRVKITYGDVKPPVLDIRHSAKKLDCLKSSQLDGEKAKLPNLAFPCRGLDQETSKKLLMSIKKEASTSSAPESDENEADGGVKGNLVKIEGELYTDRQYHFHMETQICICLPKENGMDVYSSTQHMDGIQAVIAAALQIPANE